MKTSRTLVAPLAAALFLFACAEAPDGGPGGRIALSVAPLSYPGVTNATYTLEVRNKSGQTVFTRALDSLGYGGGDGSLSYVGPCDADPAENPNTVHLTLTGLFAGGGGSAEIPATSYHNPGELTRSATCDPNADTPVTFDLTIARAANQGFFDVAVAFENIFCSAKLDCVDDDGATLELLHQAGGGRGRTVALGLACTGDTSLDGETYLYRDAVVVTCAAGTATVDPSAGPGNLTEGAGITSTGTAPLYAAAVYRGEEQLGFNKRYWNVLLGVNDAATDCTVTTTATASPDPLVAGQTPPGSTWPYIDWDVAITGTAGVRACTTHPLDGEDPNDGVATMYADPDAPEVFTFSFAPGLGPALCVEGQSQCPYASCKALLDAGLATSDGAYAIDPDGPGTGDPALTTWCDQTTDGGGWTLVRVSNGTVTPDLRTEDAVNVAGLAGGPSADTNAQLSSATTTGLGNLMMAVNTEATYDTRVWYDRTRACNAAFHDVFYWTYQSDKPSILQCPTASSIYPPSDSRWGQDTGGYTHINYNAAHPLCFGDWNQGGKGHFCYNRNTLDWWNHGPSGDPTVYENADAHTALYVRAAPQLCSPGDTGCGYASCQDVLDAGLSTGDGVYALDPDGPNAGAAAFDAYCLMSEGGGGWTLLARVYGPSPYTFVYDGWPTLTATGTTTNFSLTLAEDTVFPAYQAVAGDELLFYDGTALCGSDHRLVQSEAFLGGVTLPTFLGALPVGDCGYSSTCTTLPAANRFAPTFYNTGCTHPLNPSAGARVSNGDVGVNVDTSNGTGRARFTVCAVDWDTGIGGFVGAGGNPDGSYAFGDMSEVGDSTSVWSPHVVTIFIR